MSSFVRVFLLLSFYAALHSLLLRPEVKLVFEALLGQRAFRGLFRLAYNVVAVVLFALFLGYAAGLPNVEIVEIYGLGAWLLLAVRLTGVGVIGWALHTHGFRAWLGIENFRSWKRGGDPRKEGIDGSVLVTGGPYRWVRNPMYSGALLFLWSVPGWTVNYLAFVLAASLYLWVGSLHEESRLRSEYGKQFDEYAAQIPRFFPHLPALPHLPRFGRRR